MALTTADVAYAAAIIDNLAALRTREIGGGSTLPVVQVSGKFGSLLWLGEITGTRVIETSRKYTRHLCTEHCPAAHSEIESRSGRWTVTGMRATIMLYNVQRYLRVQAAAARQLIDAGLGVQYQGQVVNDMRKRGWDIPDLAPHPRARVSLVGAG